MYLLPDIPYHCVSSYNMVQTFNFVLPISIAINSCCNPLYSLLLFKSFFMQLIFNYFVPAHNHDQGKHSPNWNFQ